MAPQGLCHCAGFETPVKAAGTPESPPARNTSGAGSACSALGLHLVHLCRRQLGPSWVRRARPGAWQAPSGPPASVQAPQGCCPPPWSYRLPPWHPHFVSRWLSFTLRSHVLLCPQGGDLANVRGALMRTAVLPAPEAAAVSGSPQLSASFRLKRCKFKV